MMINRFRQLSSSKQSFKSKTPSTVNQLKQADTSASDTTNSTNVYIKGKNIKVTLLVVTGEFSIQLDTTVPLKDVIVFRQTSLYATQELMYQGRNWNDLRGFGRLPQLNWLRQYTDCRVCLCGFKSCRKRTFFVLFFNIKISMYSGQASKELNSHRRV